MKEKIASFSNCNLQNNSFFKQDLIGADFSNSDLRGCDFSDANLHRANFTNVKTGKSLAQQKQIYYCIIAFLLVGISTIILVYFNHLALIINLFLLSFIVGFIQTFHPMIIAHPNTKLYVSQKWETRLSFLFIPLALIINSLIERNYLYLINILMPILFQNLFKNLWRRVKKPKPLQML